MFHRIAAAFLAVSAFAAPALAADIASRPTYERSYVSPGDNWSGFYAGLSLGYSKFEGTSGYDSIYGYGQHQTIDGKGFAYGGQIGFLKQTLSNIVFGIESDLYAGGGSGTRTVNNCSGCIDFVSKTTNRVSKDFWGSTRAVVGYDFGGLMPYITGGAAYAWLNNNSVTDSSYFGYSDRYESKQNSAALGWTVGGGVNYKISPNWSVRAQYLYTDYRVTTSSDAYSKSFAGLTDHTATVGFNYRFGGL